MFMTKTNALYSCVYKLQSLDKKFANENKSTNTYNVKINVYVIIKLFIHQLEKGFMKSYIPIT